MASALDPHGSPDRLARWLELGLAAEVALAPLPLGAVGPRGRLALEVGAFALLGLWAIRAAQRPTPLPSRLACLALVGLLALATVQALPLGAGVATWLSPTSSHLREEVRPPPEIERAEARLLAREPRSLDRKDTLSVDAGATASALRTGAAAAALLLVATTVAAVCGVRRLATALLVAASFQGLYGVLVLSSGHDQIWNVPKLYYLDSATGTFVNRNHFACYVNLGLACGLALVLAQSRTEPTSLRRPLLKWLGPEGSRNLLLGLLLVTGLAGLFVSFSRAGIACGLVALGFTAVAATRAGGRRLRGTAALAILCLALVPLARIGTDRLFSRYARAADDFGTAGSRGTVWRDTLEMARAFPVTGAGFGAFAAAYPRFRAPEVRLYYAHAHNDLVQAVAESGAVGSALLLLLLVAIGRRLLSALAGGADRLAVGFAAGLLAVAMHSLIDFNLHIPAILAAAATAAGALEGLAWRATR